MKKKVKGFDVKDGYLTVGRGGGVVWEDVV